MKVIFTITLGRSGSDYLAGALNEFGIGVFAEHEPPNLLLARLGQHRFFRRRNWLQHNSRWVQLGRDWQRKHLFTDAMLGRGPAFEWLEQGDTQKLRDAISAKSQRIARHARRGYDAYVEVSQFFIKTQAPILHELIPDMGLIKLTRDPLQAARSLANRDKDLFAGGPPPDYRQNIFRIDDWQHLSRFQVFLHRWLETELRFHQFVEDAGIEQVFEMRTEELSSAARLAELFRFFDLRHRPIRSLEKSNTNTGSRFPSTEVSRQDWDDYYELLDMMPADLRDRIEFLKRSDIDVSRPYATTGT